ncbi:hypothetical protein C808_04749 [Lachnospiraceae bacterium M18-1]|nr:hypothetical protein C808_04749 [Lachnospiraceae bacterium M18-1]
MGAKKKLLCLFLAVCFMWILQPATVSAEGGIQVGGIDILQAPDHTVQCGGGTAKYDPGTKILTLNNASITGNDLLYGIQIEEQGVTVELAGQNTIEACIGIWSRTALRIKGNGGSLAVYAAKNQNPVIACRGISIESGGLTVQDTDIQIQVRGLNTAVSGYAVETRGGGNLISNSRITIDMEYVHDTYPTSTGINASGADSFTISDNSSVTMKNVDMGVGIGDGRLLISGSSLTIETADISAVSCNSLEIRNGSDVSAIANSGLALGANTNITISDSTVNAESTGTNSIRCSDLMIEDSSNVTAKGYWSAFFVDKNSVIKDSVIEAVSKADVGIYCADGNLEIAGSEVESKSEGTRGGILVNGNLTFNDSKVVSPGASGIIGIDVRDDITINGGTTEIGAGSIASGNNIYIGGVITSNGVPSYDKIESSNSNGQVTFLDADYSAVDEAIAKAEALNKKNYTNFDTVEAAVNAVVRGKDVREQDVVDGYAAAIEAAIAALNPLPVIAVIEGADQTIAAGANKSVTIRADGDFSKFVSVSVDGTETAKENYTAASGSTIITLKPEYVKTLAAGKHTVAIYFTDGLAQTSLTIEKQTSGNPSGKPDTPAGRPEDPSETPDDPSETPDDPSETPDDPSDGTEQKPSQDPTQKPSKDPSQVQGNKQESPKTGDSTAVSWLIVLAAVSAAGLAAAKRR